MGRSSDFPPCCFGKIRRAISTEYFVEPHLCGHVDYCVVFVRAQGSAALHVVESPHAAGFTGRVVSRCSEPSTRMASACHSDERCSSVDPVTGNLETARGAEQSRVDIDLRYGLLKQPRVIPKDDRRRGLRVVAAEMQSLRGEIDRAVRVNRLVRRQSFLGPRDGAFERGFEAALDPD